jgi:membrane associated rhomboid family serine protease
MQWRSSEYEYRLPPLTAAVRWLLLAMLVAFAIQIPANALSGGAFTRLFGLSIPGLKSGYLWQPLSYLFVHGGLWHLFLNGLTLFFIGPETERRIGTRQFLVLFFVSGILGGLGWLLITDAPWAVCIGASGAVFGILGAFAALFPNRPVTVLIFFVLPVTMRAWVLALGLGLMELTFLLTSSDGSIAYAAHLAGGVAGYIYARIAFGGGGAWNRLVARSRGFRRVDDAASPAELDRILDKIARSGMTSLTRGEKEFLDRESHDRRGAGR